MFVGVLLIWNIKIMIHEWFLEALSLLLMAVNREKLINFLYKKDGRITVTFAFLKKLSFLIKNNGGFPF